MIRGGKISGICVIYLQHLSPEESTPQIDVE